MNHRILGPLGKRELVLIAIAYVIALVLAFAIQPTLGVILIVLGALAVGIVRNRRKGDRA